MLLIAYKDIGLAVNTGKTRYMEVRSHRGVMANKHITVGNNSHEKVKICKCLSPLLTNQNYIHKEIKSRAVAPRMMLMIFYRNET